MRQIVLLVIIGLFASCGAVRVNYDYDRSADFSNYTTYNYFADMQTNLSELDEKRLLNLLDITLQIKGMVYSEEPDFFINITSDAFRAPQNTSVGVGVGGASRNVGGGVSVGIPVGGKKLQRQISFDFVDAKKDELFWQARSESSFSEDISPVVREQKLAELVDKVLSKYPPKTRK